MRADTRLEVGLYPRVLYLGMIRRALTARFAFWERVWCASERGSCFCL